MFFGDVLSDVLGVCECKLLKLLWLLKGCVFGYLLRCEYSCVEFVCKFVFYVGEDEFVELVFDVLEKEGWLFDVCFVESFVYCCVLCVGVVCIVGELKCYVVGDSFVEVVNV